MVPKLRCRQEGTGNGGSMTITNSTGPANVTGAANSATATAASASSADAIDYGPMVNYSIWLMTATAFVFLALRVYCKVSNKRRLWWDDYVLIVSWIMLTIACSLTTLAESVGFGRLANNVPPETLVRLFLICNMAGLFSVLAALWSKTSFALTLLRISDGWVLRLIWVIIVAMNLIMLTSAIMLFFQVDMTAKVGFYIFSTAFSGAMDITLSIMPWKIIWNLKMTMSRKEQIGVMVAMSMGVFAGATSIIKITKLPSLSSGDLLGNVQLVIFGIAEGAVTIIAASIPVLRALLRSNEPQQPSVNFKKMAPQLQKSSSWRSDPSF